MTIQALSERIQAARQRVLQTRQPFEEVRQAERDLAKLEEEQAQAQRQDAEAQRKAAIRQCYQEMPVLVAQMRARAELQRQDAEKLQHVCDVVVGLSPLDSHGQLSGALRTAIDNELTLLSARRWPQE